MSPSELQSAFSSRPTWGGGYGTVLLAALTQCGALFQRLQSARKREVKAQRSPTATAALQSLAARG